MFAAWKLKNLVSEFGESLIEFIIRVIWMLDPSKEARSIKEMLKKNIISIANFVYQNS